MVVEELISGAEVARRLGLSTERVRQLAGRPDFPLPAGRVGQAVVWKEGDVAEYAAGRRAFFSVNRRSIGVDKGRELAARLRHQATFMPRAVSAQVAATIDQVLETGGAINVSDKEAEAVFAALQQWLIDTDVDVFGSDLMDLRYSLLADLQDAGRIRQ